MRISVIAICKHEPELAGTLDAVLAQPAPAGTTVEVLVVDASEGRLDAIRQARPSVRWLDFAPIPGVATTIPHQRNAGIAAAEGDVIAFIDAACTPSAQWLEHLVAPVVAGEEQIVAGPVRSPGAANVYDTSADLLAQRYIDECPTGNVAIARAVFDRVGVFDERFAYGSDIDFAWRVRDARIPIRHALDAPIAHDWGTPRRQLTRMYRYGAARARLYRKHRGRLRSILRTDPVVVVYPVFLLGLPLAVVFPPYLLLLAIPVVRNRGSRPLASLAEHLVFGAGVLRELSDRGRPRFRGAAAR